tara:strand:- start:11 stop:847 length:837 start_codon:yes stop_codon:yes gene_type:complete
MSFRIGDRVECNWQNRGINFRGTIVSINGDTFDINFDDGDFEGSVPLDRLRPASSNEKNPSQLGSWPGSAPPGNWPSSSYESKLSGDISQESEAYRRWKEGSSVKSSEESSKPLYESTGVELSISISTDSAFLQNWRRKAIFGVIMTIWGVLPYISYPVWIVFFAPLRVLEGLVRLLIGGQATAPNIQFDIWVFGSGGAEPRTESTVWGNWWGFGEGDVAGYLPSIEGFLLLFLYSYSWLNIFTPTFRPLRIIFLGLCFLYIMAFSHTYIPEGWTHYS